MREFGRVLVQHREANARRRKNLVSYRASCAAMTRGGFSTSARSTTWTVPLVGLWDDDDDDAPVTVAATSVGAGKARTLLEEDGERETRPRGLGCVGKVWRQAGVLVKVKTLTEVSMHTTTRSRRSFTAFTSDWWGGKGRSQDATRWFFFPFVEH